MKRIILVISLILSTAFFGYSQPVVSTNELLELSGIVWRLAGAAEYKQNYVIDSYAKDIDTDFKKYNTHPLFTYIRELRKEPYNIGYDAVATSAMLLTLENGKIKLNPEINIERYVSEVDNRWDRPALRRYVSLLNDFYQRSRFNDFYANHHSIYERATEKMDSLLRPLNIAWFESFFGKPFGNPQVFICLSYGYNNYALRSSFMDILNKPEYGVIIGCTKIDKYGYPEFDVQDFNTAIHEFSHNFANPIIEKFAKDMVNAETLIFPYVRDCLAKIGYGTAGTMTGEGLNELFRIMYYVDLYQCAPIYDIRRNEENGFVWMQRGIRFMDNFFANRQLYPTVKDFMPEIVGFINHTADNIELIMAEFEHRHPYVTNVYPSRKTNVPINLSQIRIQFSTAMETGIIGISENNNLECSPLPVKRLYWDGPGTYVIELTGPLNRNTSYGLILPNNICAAAQSGHQMQEDFSIIFKTEE